MIHTGETMTKRSTAPAARRRRAPYRILDHTADVGLEAEGATLAEAFANAATAMYSIMVHLNRVSERVQRPVEVEADDAEGLLTAWLLELLFITEVEGLVFRRFCVREASPRHLAAVAHGEPLDPKRHPKGAVVKAVTRHGLEVGPFEGGYRIRVILDI
jgi:SHS2 domain-containing protein